jgi:hypothetical protein
MFGDIEQWPLLNSTFVLNYVQNLLSVSSTSEETNMHRSKIFEKTLPVFFFLSFPKICNVIAIYIALCVICHLEVI